MKTGKITVPQLAFLAICIALGLTCKRFISPITNILTDFIRLPGGGVAAAFSIMFLVIGASVTSWKIAGMTAGFIQGLLALSMGMSGYQGLLALVTYTVPGIVIDCARVVSSQRNRYFYISVTVLASVINAAFSNLLVFRFSGKLMILWLLVAASSGAAGGCICGIIADRLGKVPEFRTMKATADKQRSYELKSESGEIKMKKRAFYAAMIMVVAMTVLVGCSNRVDANNTVGITISSGGTNVEISMSEIDQTEFSGVLVNGKGEESEHSYRGILLRNLLTDNGIDIEESTTVTVSSADNYSAEYSGAEIFEDGKVYLAVEEDGEAVEGIDEGTGGVEVVVFGDENSKRCVRYAETITIE